MDYVLGSSVTHAVFFFPTKIFNKWFVTVYVWLEKNQRKLPTWILASGGE